MVNRPSKKRFRQEPDEAIHIVALWNLMVILIPFLLLSAVFSQTSILNLHVPQAQAERPEEADSPVPVPIVSILRDGFVLNDGQRVLAALPKVQNEYDFKKLSALLLQIKRLYPQQENIVLLSEPDVNYEALIHTMDASRETWTEEAGERREVSLFPNISIGEVGEITFTEMIREQGP